MTKLQVEILVSSLGSYKMHSVRDPDTAVTENRRLVGLSFLRWRQKLAGDWTQPVCSEITQQKTRWRTVLFDKNRATFKTKAVITLLNHKRRKKSNGPNRKWSNYGRQAREFAYGSVASPKPKHRVVIKNHKESILEVSHAYWLPDHSLVTSSLPSARARPSWRRAWQAWVLLKLLLQAKFFLT